MGKIMTEQVIVSNQIECLDCGDKPFSMHRHDFQTCKCGKVAVDGGQAYTRRLGDLDSYKELSIILDEYLVESMEKIISESLDSGRNPLGLTYAALRAIRDAGYEIKEVKEKETVDLPEINLFKRLINKWKSK